MTADKAFSMIPQFLFYFVAFLAIEEITGADLKDRGENLVAEAFYSQGEFLNLLETDERYVDGDTLKEVNLCRLQPDAIFDGYEFANEGLVISPLKYNHILYAEGGHPEDCWCFGSCLGTPEDPGKCDFRGGVKLELDNYADYISVQVLNPFSTLVMTAYTAHGDIIEEVLKKGSLFPVTIVVHGKDIVKAEIRTEYGGPWCLHKFIRFSNPKEPEHKDPPVHDSPYHVHVAIKPRICPNNFWSIENINSRTKVFPVSVLGSPEFDVESIDFASVTLEGDNGDFSIYPISVNYIDVTSPLYEKENICDCTRLPPDGFLDAIFFFNKNDILKIPEVAKSYGGDDVILTIRGTTKRSADLYIAPKMMKDTDGTDDRDSNFTNTTKTSDEELVSDNDGNRNLQPVGNTLQDIHNKPSFRRATGVVGESEEGGGEVEDISPEKKHYEDQIRYIEDDDYAYDDRFRVEPGRSQEKEEHYFYGQDCIVIVKGG